MELCLHWLGKNLSPGICGAMLTLVGKKSFTWDLQAKGANINLLNGNLTANKK